MEFNHEWTWDWPWHMFNLRDWFYMVNIGSYDGIVFLHVRVMGLRSIWTFDTNAADGAKESQ